MPFAFIGEEDMLINKNKSHYIIIPDGKRWPVTIRKSKTDRSLKKLETGITMVRDAIREIYDENPMLYSIISDAINLSHLK